MTKVRKLPLHIYNTPKMHTNIQPCGVCCEMALVQRQNMTENVKWLITFIMVGFSSSLGLTQTLPIVLLQEDFRIMRHALEQAHGGIYRYTSKRELDRAFDLAYRRVDHPMTELDFWRLLAPMIAQIKCGHTYIWFPKSLQTQFETNTPFFPL